MSFHCWKKKILDVSQNCERVVLITFVTGQYTSYGVGTPPYAAPEINRYNFTYNEKVGILHTFHRFGVVFFFYLSVVLLV